MTTIGLATLTILTLLVFSASGDVPGAEPVAFRYARELKPLPDQGLFRAIRPMKGSSVAVPSCRPCGAYHKRDCSKLCAAHAYKNYWCGPCECQCHDG